jgi:hypothetical protein
MPVERPDLSSRERAELADELGLDDVDDLEPAERRKLWRMTPAERAEIRAKLDAQEADDDDEASPADPSPANPSPKKQATPDPSASRPKLGIDGQVFRATSKQLRSGAFCLKHRQALSDLTIEVVPDK